MKKTLKVLMAIALFAVVLSIATGVSAKTFSSYVDEKTFVPNEEVGGIKSYTIDKAKAESTTEPKAKLETIEVKAGAVQLDLTTGTNNDKVNVLTANNTITIEKGAKLVISGTGSITTNIVNKGILVLQGDLEVAGMKVTNAGRIEIRTKDDETPELANNSITLTASTAEVIAPASLNGKVACETDAIKAKVGQYILKSKKDGTKLFVDTPLLPIEAYLVNSVGDKVTTLEEDAWYEVKVEGTYGFDEQTYEIVPWLPVIKGASLSDADFAKITQDPKEDNTDYTGAKKLKIKINKDLVGKAFTLDIGGYAMDGKTAITKKVALNGAVVPTTEPTATAEPTATPAPTEAPNKGDKDETPKTGDSIIPATAVLAVVVIANVVYFAKSKRS